MKQWPSSGQHIMAHYDDENIVVYQAYCREIGEYAAKHNQFGGAFSFSRMSWVKPNFLWMMYRSGWGEKEGQEITLAITIPRSLFDEILSLAVPSTFTKKLYETQEDWKHAVAHSNVRLQWDPDHGPQGSPLERRAIQLGLRGEVLARYAKDEVLQIEDISNFVSEQKENLQSNSSELLTPVERIYLPQSLNAIRRVDLAVDTQSNKEGSV